MPVNLQPYKWAARDNHQKVTKMNATLDAVESAINEDLPGFAEDAQAAAESAAEDALATAADREQTGLDRAAAAADRVQTGLDRSAAADSAAAAAASYDSFDDRYLGAKTSDPTLDNDGNALLTGALYFNSAVGEMRVRTSGGTWVQASAGAGYLPLTGGTLTGTITIDANAAAGVIASRASGDGNGAGYTWQKARGTTSSRSAVQSGDILGFCQFLGYDGTQYLSAAQILVAVDGAPGTNDMPGRVVISVTPDGGSSPQEAFRISQNKEIRIPGDCLFGTTTPGTDTAKVDIVEGASPACITLSNNSVDSTAKFGTISNRHYTNSEEGVCLIRGSMGASANSLLIGGGSSVLNAATQVSIYTAANTTTTGGTERWRWDSSGHNLPVADNTYNIGGASSRVKEIFAANGTINTSDAREKTEVEPLTENELAASIALAREIGSFKFLQAIADKGEEDARVHIGMTVQRAIQIMQDNDLEPMAYSFICFDEWPEEIGEVQTTADDPDAEPRTREVPRTTIKTHTSHEIEVIDGVPTRVTKTEDRAVEVYESRPVVDESGEPIMELAEPAREAVLDEEGNEIEPAWPETWRQVMHSVPVMDEITEYFKTAVTREAGDKYSFRVHELLLFIARGFDARLAALEAAQSS